MGKSRFTKKDIKKLLIKKANGFFYEEAQYEYEKTQKTSKNNENLQIYSDFDENKNFFKKNVRGKSENENLCDTINLDDKETAPQKNENLTLIKKKITTHYVPPDMLAIKALLEIYEKKVGDTKVENMTNEELIELKNKLLLEIKNED